MQSATETVVNTVYLFPLNEMIIGFAVIVALLLAILIAVLRRPGAKASASVPVSQAAAPAPAAYAGVDGAVVAAIAAAVAVMGQAEGRRLMVRSVRREGAWADAGRRENVH